MKKTRIQQLEAEIRHEQEWKAAGYGINKTIKGRKVTIDEYIEILKQKLSIAIQKELSQEEQEDRNIRRKEDIWQRNKHKKESRASE